MAHAEEPVAPPSSLSVHESFAHTTQGRFEASLGLGFSQYSAPVLAASSTFVSRNYSNYNISLSPGYFILDHLALGILLRYSNTSGEPYLNFSGYSLAETSLGARFHYYIPLSDRFYFRPGAGYTFITGSESLTSGFQTDQTVSISGGAFFFDVAALYFLTSSVGIGPQIEYDITAGARYTNRVQYQGSFGFHIFL